MKYPRRCQFRIVKKYILALREWRIWNKQNIERMHKEIGLGDYEDKQTGA